MSLLDTPSQNGSSLKDSLSKLSPFNFVKWVTGKNDDGDSVFSSGSDHQYGGGSTKFPKDGLKLSSIQNFIAMCGGERKLRYMTTKQVVDKFILPVTKNNRASYVEVMKKRDVSLIGVATVYIVHPWGGRFLDTYKALKYHFKNTPDVLIWMDVFCLPQYKVPKHVFLTGGGISAGEVATQGILAGGNGSEGSGSIQSSPIKGKGESPAKAIAAAGAHLNSFNSPEGNYSHTMTPSMRIETVHQATPLATSTINNAVSSAVSAQAALNGDEMNPVMNPAMNPSPSIETIQEESRHHKHHHHHHHHHHHGSASTTTPTPHEVMGGVPGMNNNTQQQQQTGNYAQFHAHAQAGDWYSDLLKHGMDEIGYVVMVANPRLNTFQDNNTSNNTAGGGGGGGGGDSTAGGSGYVSLSGAASLAANNNSSSSGGSGGGIANQANQHASGGAHSHRGGGSVTARSGISAFDASPNKEFSKVDAAVLHPLESDVFHRLWCLYEIYCAVCSPDAVLVNTQSGKLVLDTKRPNNTSGPAAGGAGYGGSTSTSKVASKQSKTQRPHQVPPLIAIDSNPFQTNNNNSHGGRGLHRQSSRKQRRKQNRFEVALCFKQLEDTPLGVKSNSASAGDKDKPTVSGGNIYRSKKSVVDLNPNSVIADLEAFARSVWTLNLSEAQCGDGHDLDRLISIITIDIGVDIFVNTIQNILLEWMYEFLDMHSEKANVNATTKMALQHCRCSLIHIKGDTVRAEGSMIEIWEQQKSDLGPDDPNTLQSIQLLAEFYIQLNRLTDAEPLLIECLERRKTTLGPKHTDYVRTLDQLADLYASMEVWHLAEPLYEECYELKRRSLGGEHIATLEVLFRQANMCFNQEEFVEAEVLMLKCLDQRREALGAQHLDTIASLKKLAVLYEIQQRYTAAELVYHEYLHAVSIVYGVKSVIMLDAMYLLATNYRNQYKYTLAEPLYRYCADTYKTTLSADDECTLAAMLDLADLYEDVVDFTDALVLQTSLLSLLKQKFGEEHSRVSDCMYAIANLHLKLGKTARAEDYLVRCLELRSQHLGATYVETLRAQNCLAYVYIDHGRYEEAEGLLVRSIEIGSSDELIKSHGRSMGGNAPSHSVGKANNNNNNNNNNNSAGAVGINQSPMPSARSKESNNSRHTHFTNMGVINKQNKIVYEDTVVLEAMNNLGLMYCQQGRLVESEALFMKAWETYRSVYGDQHPDVLTTVHNLAGLYMQQQKFDLAEYFYSECLRKRTTVLGSQHLLTLTTLSCLAAQYTKQGKYDIAEHMLLECYDQCCRSKANLGTEHAAKSIGSTVGLGEDHPLTLSVLTNIAFNCESLGQWRRAETVHKQCLVKRRLTLGAMHPQTLSSMNNLASLYVTQRQQLKKAERLLKECLSHRQQVLGMRHPHTLHTVNNLATLYVRSNRRYLAMEVYTDCAEECMEQLGPDHYVSKALLANLTTLEAEIEVLEIVENSIHSASSAT